MKKKLLSILLCLCMVLGLLPTMAAADETNEIRFYNDTARIYSGVTLSGNGTDTPYSVDLTGKTADTDGTFSMQADTGYYAEAIYPAKGNYKPWNENALFGCYDLDNNWTYIYYQPNITPIRDSNGKIAGFYFTASADTITSALDDCSLRIDLVPEYDLWLDDDIQVTPSNLGGTLADGAAWTYDKDAKKLTIGNINIPSGKTLDARICSAVDFTGSANVISGTLKLPAAPTDFTRFTGSGVIEVYSEPNALYHMTAAYTMADGKWVAYGGDVSSSGLDLTTAPTAVTRYSAGSGYILFTPAAAPANAKLELVDATIDASAKTDATNAITLPNAPVDVTVTGSNTLKAAGSGGSGNGNGSGIYAPNNLSIGGSGSLNVGGGSYGIYCTNDGALTVSIAGALNVTGKNNAAVDSSDDISITAASVTADSQYFSVHSGGGMVSVTATSGDITLTRTRKGSDNVSGSKGIALTANAGKITVTGGEDSLVSSGNITVTAENDVAVTGSSSDGIKGAAVSLTSGSGSVKVVGGYRGIYATTSVTLSAPRGDVTVEGNSSGYAVSASGKPVYVTAGGTASFDGPWGMETGALTIQANRVAVSGTDGSALQSGGINPGVTITNPTGGSCESVNLTANGNGRAAIQCGGGDVTIKADNMVIQGKTSANAIVCGTSQNDQTLTLTGAGYVIGACSLYPAKENQTSISSTVVFDAAAATATADWTDTVDLSKVTVKTILVGKTGCAVWEPTLESSALKSGKLTLHSADGASLTLPDVPVEIVCSGASEAYVIDAKNALKISGAGSLSANLIRNADGTDTTLTVASGATLNTEYSVKKTGSAPQYTIYGSYNEDGYQGLCMSAGGKITLTPGSTLTLSGSGYLEFYQGAQLAGLTVGAGAKIVNNTHITFPQGTTPEQIAALPVSGPGVIRIATGYNDERYFPSSYDVLLYYVSANTSKGSVTPAFERVAATGTTAGATAKPVSGCRFVSWTDQNGNVVSTDANLKLAHPTGGTYTANFAGTPTSNVPVAPPDTGAKVTIPVSSGEGSVKVEATVKDGTAAVTLTDAQITEIASGKSATGTVKLDVSSLDVKAATIPAKVIAAAEKSGNTDGIQVALPTGTVTLDKTALAVVSDKGGDVTVSVDKVDNAKLTETQKAVLGSQARTALVVDVTVLASGEKVSAFNGGSIGVAVSYTPKANEDTSKLVVWFINDDGSIEPKTGSYNAKTGKYEFQTQHLSQYVLVSFPFKDVSASSWYYGSVAYAYMNGLFSGTGDTTFSPETTMTRGMLVTVLYRMEGSPAVTADSSFTDVAADAYYAKAVRWAAVNKIVGGYGDGSFAPNDTVTRQQMAAILYRYASLRAYDVSAAASLDGFADSASVSDYAKSALAWAVSTGLVKGGDNKLMPGSGATRAQVAAILQRFRQKIGK